MNQHTLGKQKPANELNRNVNSDNVQSIELTNLNELDTKPKIVDKPVQQSGDTVPDLPKSQLETNIKTISNVQPKVTKGVQPPRLKPVTLSELSDATPVRPNATPIDLLDNKYIQQNISQFSDGIPPGGITDAEIPPLVNSQLLIGYRYPDYDYQIPELWKVKFLEHPLPLIVPATHMVISPSKIGTLLSYGSEVIDSLVNPILEVFNRGMGISIPIYNPTFLAKYSLRELNGVIYDDSVIPPTILEGGAMSNPMNLTKIVSGAFRMAGAMILEYDGLPIIQAAEIQSTSKNANTLGLEWLQSNWIVPPTINPAMVKYLTNTDYIDVSFPQMSYQQFKIGRTRLNRVIAGNKILKSTWALTYDNISTSLMGIANRHIDNDRISHERLCLLALAHAPLDTTYSRAYFDPELYQPICINPPEYLISQFFATLAINPTFRQYVRSLYSDYILTTGLVKYSVESITEEVATITGTSGIREELYTRIGKADFDSVIEALAFEIAPTFDYPDINQSIVSSSRTMFFSLIETMLFFVLFPKMAKYTAYELCNTLKSILSKLDPLSWQRYITTDGYIYGQPGTNSPIKRNEYLLQGISPTLLHGPQANQSWGVMRSIATLIAPIGTMERRTRAIDAGLPIIDEAIFLPWDDPRENSPDVTLLYNRLLAIVFFVRTTMLPQFRAYENLGNAQVSSYGIVLSLLNTKLLRCANGFGRGVRRLFRGMIDFSTNIIHGYDGNLATPIPHPIHLFDDITNLTRPMPVQSLNSGYTINTLVVWPVLFNTSWLFDNATLQVYEETLRCTVPSPQDTMARHMNVFAYSQSQTMGIGLVTQLLSIQGRDERPYSYIRDLIREARATDSLLSSSSMRKLNKLILESLQINQGTIGILETVNQAIQPDIRYTAPILRRMGALSEPLPPLPTDRAPLVGGSLLLSPRHEDMFRYAFSSILDPQSYLSRMGRGVAFRKTLVDSVRFEDILPLHPNPNAIFADISEDNFTIVSVNNRAIRRFTLNGRNYDVVDAVPPCQLTIAYPGKIREPDMIWLLTGVVQGNISLVFPRAVYIYSIVYMSLDDYAASSRSDLLPLVKQMSDSIVGLTLPNSYTLTTDLTTLSVSHTYRFIYPMEPPTVSVLFRDAITTVQAPTYTGPSPQTYDTGRMDEQWNSYYTNGRIKTYRGLSLANELICYEKRDGVLVDMPLDLILPSVLSET